MRYLFSGGKYKSLLVTYRSSNNINNCMEWACDNNCFSQEINYRKMRMFLDKKINLKNRCLFVVVPDKVGDAKETLSLWNEYSPKLRGWPLAFVCQDGMNYGIPDGVSTLFIGGSTEWKMGEKVVEYIRMAQKKSCMSISDVLIHGGALSILQH